jgi:hypothetical protein
VTGHPLAAREPRPFPSAQETPAVLRDTSAGEPSKVLPRVPACSLLPRAIGFAVVIVQGNWGGDCLIGLNRLCSARPSLCTSGLWSAPSGVPTLWTDVHTGPLRASVRESRKDQHLDAWISCFQTLLVTLGCRPVIVNQADEARQFRRPAQPALLFDEPLAVRREPCPARSSIILFLLRPSCACYMAIGHPRAASELARKRRSFS